MAVKDFLTDETAEVSGAQSLQLKLTWGGVVSIRPGKLWSVLQSPRRMWYEC
jgi:hypothetical protein